MTLHRVPGAALLFQVRSLALTLRDRIGLSISAGALPEPKKEMAAAATSLVAPSVQKKNKKKRVPTTHSDQRTILESKAEHYMKRFVLAHLPADKMIATEANASAQDFRKAATRVFLDMETTVFPATLLACLILNMRDARMELKDMDPSGEISVDRLLTVLANDVYGAKARALLLCQTSDIANKEKIKLGREITMATELLGGLSIVAGVALPPDTSNHKVAVMEEAKRKRALAAS